MNHTKHITQQQVKDFVNLLVHDLDRGLSPSLALAHIYQFLSVNKKNKKDQAAVYFFITQQPILRTVLDKSRKVRRHLKEKSLKTGAVHQLHTSENDRPTALIQESTNPTPQSSLTSTR